jgi:pantoate--beta-alanine ligase
MTRQIKTIDALREATSSAGSLGLVPTMGALHAGHMALVKRARAENDCVVVSIFVNPLQFGAGEDLERYPNPLDADMALLNGAGVDVVYLPTPNLMYPQGFQTGVKVGALADTLCGASRQGHFDGVATVVLKLFNQVQPNRAYFGEKDYQQLCIINRLIKDFNLSLEVIGVPTVRETDGLALSSRNQYLSDQERAIAPALFANLRKCAENIKKLDALGGVLKFTKSELLAQGFTSVDYLEYCDPISLKPLLRYQAGARVLAAAKLGQTRLIDNIAL